MNQLNLKARAKINLALDVLNRREDGYHDLRMIMQTINVYDRILIKKIKKPEIVINTNLPFIPTNKDNLVYKAAELLRENYNIDIGLYINLHKVIPVAAGLAGGSSDAAAVLFGVNKLFDLGLSIEELMSYGVKVGADVPYCLLRGTALAEGIGEKLTPLPPMPRCIILIAKPNISVSTGYIFTNLKVNEIKEHPQIDDMIIALNKQDLKGIADLLSNVLETVTIPKHPVIQDIKQVMMDNGALGSIMSGSGPTVFGIYNDYSKAKNTMYRLKENNIVKNVHITDVYNNYI